MPIPKSAQPERLLENLNVFDFQLTDQEIESFKKFDSGCRLWRNEMAKFHQYWPFAED